MVDVWVVDFVTGEAWVAWRGIRKKQARKLKQKWKRKDAELVLRVSGFTPGV